MIERSRGRFCSLQNQSCEAADLAHNTVRVSVAPNLEKGSGCQTGASEKLMCEFFLHKSTRKETILWHMHGSSEPQGFCFCQECVHECSYFT